MFSWKILWIKRTRESAEKSNLLCDDKLRSKSQRNSNERKSWRANSAAEAMRCQTHNVSQNNEQPISSQNARLCQETKKTTPRTTCPELHQHPEQHWFLPVFIFSTNNQMLEPPTRTANSITNSHSLPKWTMDLHQQWANHHKQAQGSKLQITPW